MASSEIQDNPLVVSDQFLQYLAGELTEEWQPLARYLNITEGQLYDKRKNHIGDVKEAKYQTLLCWKKKNVQNATRSVLANALFAVGRGDLSDKVENDHPASPMDHFTHVTNANVELFVKEIKIRYRELCNSVQPIPYYRDRMKCVDKVFIESRIEFFTEGLWEQLDSYHCMLTDPRLQSTRYILNGAPGFGKSTLALQLAFDWYTRRLESALSNVEILIFLQLRKLSGRESIYAAIKQFLLPRESQLSIEDIQEILRNSKSVVFVFDGFNEYVQTRGDSDDITHIISGRMFNNFKVVLTTRPSCKNFEFTPTTTHLRLSGFDSAAQEKYIRKALVGNDTNAVTDVTSRFQGNPVLRDLCEVPLFFVLFSHIAHEKKESVNFDSVTIFFRYMIATLHEHMKNKLKDNDLRVEYEHLENNHQKLDKAAFKACAEERSDKHWRKEDFQNQIGISLYNQYIKVGILIEEEKVIINDEPGSSNLVQHKTHVRFFHTVFCDWYAAHRLSSYLDKRLKSQIKNPLKRLDPFELQYVFRFTCGINRNASSKIIKYLRNVEGGDKFAILCILEQAGNIDGIKKSIRQLCREGVIISGHDSLLLQRSSLQLLEMATKYNIPIEYVELYNCLQSVDLSKPAIITTSGLALSSQIRIKRLNVSSFNREMTKDEFIAVLKFSSECPSLLVEWFKGSVPPKCFNVDRYLTRLQSRHVTVEYSGLSFESQKYILNLSTGQWESKEGRVVCTDEDFEKMRLNWDEVKDCTEKTHKSKVKMERKELSRRASEMNITMGQ